MCVLTIDGLKASSNKHSVGIKVFSIQIWLHQLTPMHYGCFRDTNCKLQSDMSVREKEDDEER